MLEEENPYFEDVKVFEAEIDQEIQQIKAGKTVEAEQERLKAGKTVEAEQERLEAERLQAEKQRFEVYLEESIARVQNAIGEENYDTLGIEEKPICSTSEESFAKRGHLYFSRYGQNFVIHVEEPYFSFGQNPGLLVYLDESELWPAIRKALAIAKMEPWQVGDVLEFQETEVKATILAAKPNKEGALVYTIEKREGRQIETERATRQDLDARGWYKI